MNIKSSIIPIAFVLACLFSIHSCKKDDCKKLMWYQDQDADNFGNPNVPMEACEQPAGYVADNTDFNDASKFAHPGASEICTDGIDNDNDGFTDCDDYDCECDESANCFDGIDNDNDGFVDCEDYDCDCDESANCNDGIDNDNDGFVDCDDLDCTCN